LEKENILNLFLKMKINLFPKTLININDQEVELVERKGLGHPDTLSDILADTFSRKYSEFSLIKYGCILNHAVDKVTLLGAKAEVNFGKAKIIKPITACLFGKASLKVNDEIIDIESMFKEAVKEVFINIFHSEDILKNIQYLINVHDGIGFDHPKGFYSPNTNQDIKNINSELRSNDTVICSAYAPYSKVEILTIKIENYLNSEEFKKDYPETGFDIKVLITRIGDRTIDATVCIPFIASKTPRMTYYRRKLKEIEGNLLMKIREWFDYKDLILNINTKDEGGKYAYLTVYGSALDKGDQGMVGRGNRFNGVISVNREMNVEAAAGKNPIHHSGKIYNFVSHLISKEIFNKYNIYNSVFISAKNGDLLNKPSYVIIKTAEGIGVTENEIYDVVTGYLNNLDRITSRIVESDPILDHKMRAFY
jgi:S-adenosylmethionine synthetase